MQDNHKKKKLAANKIAFLGLLIVALLIARLIISQKSSITLTEPIKLDFANLSVSIPTKNGWQNEKKWQYKNNAFTITSICSSSPGSLTTLAHCQYLLAEPKTTADELFKRMASEMNASIEKTDFVQVKTPDPHLPKDSQTKPSLLIEWAHIKKQKTLSDIFFGTIQLPNNRQLNIEVHDNTGDTDFVEKIFKNMVKKLKFEDDRLLTAGSEVVENIKKTGISRLLANQDQETFFLIKEGSPLGTDKQIVGFTMDTLKHTAGKQLSNQTFNIQATNFYYIRGSNAREHIELFQSDNSFNEFIFKSQTISTNEAVAETILDKTGNLTVRKSQKWAHEKTCRPGPAAIPEVLLEQLLHQMLNSKYKKIVVDIILAEGKIIPAVISRKDAQDTTAAEKTSYTLTMELKDGRGLSEKVYLNNQKHVLRIILERTEPSGQRQIIYTLERTNLKNILTEFPERADYILKTNTMLKQKQIKHQDFF